MRLLLQLLLCVSVLLGHIYIARKSFGYVRSPLGVIVRPIAWSRDYDPERENFAGPELLAGSYALLIVNNEYDTDDEFPENGWPVNYTITAGLDLSNSDEFVPSEGLFESMYLSGGMISSGQTAKHMREQGNMRIPSSIVNSKQFIIRIPEEIVGHTLRFNVEYNTGDTLLTHTMMFPIRIIESSSRDDQAMIFSSLIYAMYKTKDYDGAIEIADLMLKTNYTFARGWYLAYQAAMYTRRYDKMISYLEKLWADFGRISVHHTEPVPEYNPDGKRDHNMSEAFKERISVLRKLLAEQQSDSTK